MWNSRDNGEGPRDVCRYTRWLAFCLTFLVSAETADADLYTGYVLSVEWLVDSADVICSGHFVKSSEDSTRRVFQVDQWAKSKMALCDLNKAIDKYLDDRYVTPVEFMKANTNKWLLFLRQSNEAKPVLFRRVHLTRPLESSRTAAVTVRGVALPDEKSVMAAVRRRIRMGRQIPADCDRSKFDSVGSRVTGSLTSLHHYIGAFPTNTYCEYWDMEGPYDFDTLYYVIVPADPEFHTMLLRQLEIDGQRNWKVISSLVNYPGPKTVTALRKLEKIEAVRATAQSVLEYLEHGTVDTQDLR